jgi:hypothetical protein
MVVFIMLSLFLILALVCIRDVIFFKAIWWMLVVSSNLTELFLDNVASLGKC